MFILVTTVTLIFLHFFAIGNNLNSLLLKRNYIKIYYIYLCFTEHTWNSPREKYILCLYKTTFNARLCKVLRRLTLDVRFPAESGVLSHVCHSDCSWLRPQIKVLSRNRQKRLASHCVKQGLKFDTHFVACYVPSNRLRSHFRQVRKKLAGQVSLSLR